MAVFIELTTDAFADRFASNARRRTSAGAGLPSVRRPMRGLEIKEDTYAYIKLIRNDGSEVLLLDSSSEAGFGFDYSNFILQSVQENRMERHQVVETFGDTYLFLFGESPRFLQVQAVLLNSLDFNWEAEFDYNYENFLRGTKSIEQGARCYLFYDDNVVEGYILNASKMKDAQNPLMVQLSFQFFVTNSSNVSINGSVADFPIRQSATVPAGVDLTQMMNGEQVDALLSSSLGNSNGLASFNNSSFQVPLRSKIYDNKDEYTTPTQPSYAGIFDLPEAVREEAPGLASKAPIFADRYLDLGSYLAQCMSGYGVDEAQAYSPFTYDTLGVGPTFLPGGVGVGSGGGQNGAVATFGASASFSAGGFAGMGVGIGASVKTGFSASAGAYAGASVSARAGASFGASAGASVSLTARAGGRASAYASAQAGVQAGLGGYAYASTQRAALAGGYAGAGAYMGTYGYNSYAGASYAGSSGYGPGVVVGGEPTAFAFASFSGNLTNTGKKPAQAMASANASGWGEPWGWSWSWPSSESSIDESGSNEGGGL